MADIDELKNLINPHKTPDKQFFLDLLDGDKQRVYEDEHLSTVLKMLKVIYINKLRLKIKSVESERDELTRSPDYTAEKYQRVLELNAQAKSLKEKTDSYKCFFEESYFARMDVVDDKEGYNSYYIGKRGDEGLEIVDWRAPLARRYYQKSKLNFKINEYDYKVILRRAIRVKNGKILDMKNEYLSVKDYLTTEEIGGRDEAVIFDPFLKEILKSRKEKSEITDIIETIQEKQYEIITLPENEQFILQGVAGSGKTMIMLHRLSYIMYNNENIKPGDVLVITPSNSFNAFIDELAAILELERVRTSTITDYYIRLLKSIGMDASKCDPLVPVPEEYLSYIYSEKFGADIDKKLGKIYDGIFGMFSSEECKSATAAIEEACARQERAYEKIKNAGLRVRRCVLGEIKEKKDGGLYYTKPFRTMFNCLTDVREFLSLADSDGRMKNYAFFYRQLLSFYKSVRYLRRLADKICSAAKTDLLSLKETVEKEIFDLRRYKMKLGERETFTYAQGIEKREKLIEEIDENIARVEEIENDFAPFHDFADVIRGETHFVSIGKCENVVDVMKFFYREILKPIKQRYGVVQKPLIKSDPFSLCLIATKLGFNLTPKFAFMFIDEAQDISPCEYAVISAVNERAIINIFGDLKQNVTPYRGINDWKDLNMRTFEMNLNYRNTNEIVEYVSKNLGIDMSSVGGEGEQVIKIGKRQATGWLTEHKGLKAIICTEADFPQYVRKSYNVLRETGKISKSKINLMTVYESKGLEFTAVAVADKNMTVNEKYIAYTRALKELAILE